MITRDTYEVKHRFVSETLSRRVSELWPNVRCLEYYLHDNGDEVAIIRLADNTTRRVDVTGLELQDCVQAILARLEEVA